MEQRVIERTADLARANESLQAEIKERIHAEEQTLQKTQELDRIFTLSLDLLCIVDSKGRFIRLNPVWEQILGFPLAELVKFNYLDLVHPDDLPATMAMVDELIAGKEVIDFTNRYRCQDGSYRWIEWRSKPHLNNLIYVIARDITARKQAETQLNEQLDELNRWHTTTLGREERILDLKREVNEFLAQTGRPPRYLSVED